MTSLEKSLQILEGIYRSLAPFKNPRFDPIARVQELISEGSIEAALGEFYQLEFFCKHLNDVRNIRPPVFEELIKRLSQCAQANNFFGLRMEARMTSSIARKGLAFELQERPDIAIKGNLFIECGSVWPETTDPTRDYRTRVASAILAKDRKRYASPNTILALENTAVVAAMANHGLVDEQTDFHAYLASLTNEMEFGSILLFTTIYSDETKKVSSAYVRLDSPRIATKLATFMEAFFPRPGVQFDLPFVPGQKKFPGDK